MADTNTIARPYAQAVFELAREAGELEAWSESLELMRAVMESGEVVAYLGDPAFSDARRLEFLTGLFERAGASKLDGRDRQGTNFLKLLIENDRLAALPEIARHFGVLRARTENVVDVVVTSASPLGDELRDRITKALEARLGCDVKLESEIDETLIGGAVIKAGDVVIDGSLRARLDGLANALTK